MTEIKNLKKYLSINQRQLLIILLVALINGLLYVWIIPPWQHYDEPSHFEYAWLLANRPGYLNPGDYDLEMRRSVVESMIQNGFYDRIPDKPDLQSESPPSIGVQQLDEQPLYYLLLSLPFNLAKSWDMSSQLVLGRLISTLLYLITILAAWGVTREITASQNPLRWVVPISISLLPGFTDIMTSVNNDAGAIAFFSLFFWGSTRFIRRGFNWLDLIWVVSTALVCVFMKTTVLIAIPILFFVLFLVLTRSLNRWVRLAIVGLIIVVGLGTMLQWGEALFWYRASNQQSEVRSRSNNPVVGDFIFQVDTSASLAPQWMKPLVQPLPKKDTLEIAGKVVTLGVWMWADRPVKVRTPALHDSVNVYSKIVQLGEQPAFYAFNVKLPEKLERTWVSISPKIGKNSTPGVVYLDGLVLVDGERSIFEAPHFSDSTGKTGEWDGKPFTNRLRNGSAEMASVGIQDWFNGLGTDYFPHYARPSFILAYFIDWFGTDWHLQKISSQLFRSLWGIFGWGNIYFIGSKPYRIFFLFFLFGTAGSIYWLWQTRKNPPWELIMVFGLVLVTIWGGAFIRGISHLPTNRLALPVARYAYPAIIPTMTVFAVGYLALFRLFLKKSLKADTLFSLVYLAIFVCFNIWALISLSRFYS